MSGFPGPLKAQSLMAVCQQLAPCFLSLQAGLSKWQVDSAAFVHTGALVESGLQAGDQVFWLLGFEEQAGRSHCQGLL